MKRTDNQSIWDAKRFLQEYLKLAKLIKSNQDKPFEDIVWSNQIRVKRIASVLRAFMGLKDAEGNPVDLIMSIFDGWHFDRLFEGSPLQADDHAKLMALVKETMNDDHRYESLTRMYASNDEVPSRLDWRDFRDRRYMLHVLLEYRVAAEKLISHFDGLMAGTVGTYLCALAVKTSCIEPLKFNNEKIDDIVVLLLGDRFKQSFSVEELISGYGYPKETDDELLEWDSDNY